MNTFIEKKIYRLIYTRDYIEKLILASLKLNKRKLQEQFLRTKSSIGYFFLDDLLPDNLVSLIYDAFPNNNAMVLKNNLREFKYVGYHVATKKNVFFILYFF